MLQNDQALLRYLAGNFSPMLVINKRILDVQVLFLSFREKREISYDIEPLTKELLSRFIKLQLNPTTWDLIELFWINYPFCFPFEHLREKDTYGAGELISFFPEDNWNEMVHNWDLNYPHCNFLDKAKKWEVETFGNRSHYNSRADYYTRVRYRHQCFCPDCTIDHF